MATFGNTNLEAGISGDGGTPFYRGGKFALTEAATPTSMSWGGIQIGATPNLKMAIYTDVGGAPGILVGYPTDAVVIGASKTFYTANFTGVPFGLTVGDYWLVWMNDAGGGGVNYAASALAGGVKYGSTGSYPTFPSSFGTPTGTENNKCSIYVTYTVGYPTPSGAIQRDNGAVNMLQGSGGGAGPITGNYTVGTGANRFLILLSKTVASVDVITAVTYAGVSMTKLGSVQLPSGNYISCWYLVNPTSGTNAFSATISQADSFTSNAVSLIGVRQSAPEAVSSPNTGTSTTGSVSITTLSVSAWAMSVWGLAGGANVGNDALFLSGESSNTDIGITHRYDDPIATPGAKTLSFTPSSSVAWAALGFSLAPAETRLLPSMITSISRKNIMVGY